MTLIAIGIVAALVFMVFYPTICWGARSLGGMMYEDRVEEWSFLNAQLIITEHQLYETIRKIRETLGQTKLEAPTPVIKAYDTVEWKIIANKIEDGIRRSIDGVEKWWRGIK